ncbi:MAG: hypothetical protein AB1758_04180 [Candidatus Eremiobacterota bacterium]
MLDPFSHTAEIYRPGRPAERAENPRWLSGEDVLPGLELDLTDLL